MKASKNSPEFIDPFNCDPATEPTGPPNTLTTTPTEEATEEATEEVAEEEKIPKVNIDVKIPTAEAGQSDERVNASERNNAAADASDSVRKDQDGVPESPLVLHSPVTVRTNNNGEPSCNAGPLIFKTNSNGEHVLLPLPDFPPTHTASEATRDGEHDDSRRKRRTCAPRCVLM